MPIVNEWRWAHPIALFVNDWRSEPRFAYFSGAHEGYFRLSRRVDSARRKIFYLRGGYWILIDRFTPGSDADAHTYRQHFHVGVPSRLRRDGSLVTGGRGGNLLILPVEGARGSASKKPCDRPLPSYTNPDHVTYTRRARGPQILVSLLVPFAGRRPDVKAELLPVEADGRALSPWEATGLKIAIGGERHVYVDQHMQWNLPWRCGSFSGSSRLFHSAIHRTGSAGL